MQHIKLMTLGRPKDAAWLVAALIAVAALFLGSARIAAAYNARDNPDCTWPYSGGYSLLTVYFQDTSSGDYASTYSAARSSWYATSTPAAFSYSPSASSTHGQYYEDNLGVFGVTYPACSGTTTTGAAVWLSTNRLSTPPYAGIFWKQYTAAHELGHNIMLDHSLFDLAIMFYTSRPSSFETAPYPSGGFNGPQADDTCGVNHLYPSSGWPPACGY